MKYVLRSGIIIREKKNEVITLDITTFNSEQGAKHTNEELYYRQVELLKTFLEKNAISQAQFDKSFSDLTEKMGMSKIQNKDK